MKKEIVGFVAITAIALTAGWNMSQNNNEIKLSELTLNNVEALASGESSEEFENATGCRAVLNSSSCYGKDGKTHSYAERK